MNYLIAKWLHVLSSTLLFGTGLGSAYYMFFASRTRDPRTVATVVRYVVLPFTRVGVIGGIMLGLGRALGETMAVTFVIGNAHKVSASLLESSRTAATMKMVEGTRGITFTRTGVASLSLNTRNQGEKARC